MSADVVLHITELSRGDTAKVASQLLLHATILETNLKSSRVADLELILQLLKCLGFNLIFFSDLSRY